MMLSYINPNKYYVFWTNHGYFSSEYFTDKKDAIAYGNEKGFEYSLWKRKEIIGYKTAFGGYRNV